MLSQTSRQSHGLVGGDVPSPTVLASRVARLPQIPPCQIQLFFSPSDSDFCLQSLFTNCGVPGGLGWESPQLVSHLVSFFAGKEDFLSSAKKVFF